MTQQAVSKVENSAKEVSAQIANSKELEIGHIDKVTQNANRITEGEQKRTSHYYDKTKSLESL